MSVSHTLVKFYEGPVTKRRQPSEEEVVFTGAPYEIPDDLVKRLRDKMARERATQGSVARELKAYLRKRDGVTYAGIDQSSISNLLSKRYPSSRFAGPIADMYGWPRPPVARVMIEESETMETTEKLLRLRAASEEKYQLIVLMLDGHLLQAEGAAKLARARAGEAGVRPLDPKKTPEDNGD
jgi:hypothetical protein